MVTLSDSRKVIAAAEGKAMALEQPMNIAVADRGGNLVAHVDEAWLGRHRDMRVKPQVNAGDAPEREAGAT